LTRLLPEGEPLKIRGSQEMPVAFLWRGTSHRIVEICSRWRVHTYWWEPDRTVWREYVKVATSSGLLCLIYRDLLTGGWFLARIYD
jgi:hypothetical protein